MSFDILATNGDIQFNNRGDVAKVVDSDKLAQDVIKMLNTTLGSDPLNPSYGSPLTVNLVGRVPSREIAQMKVAQILEESLDKMIRLQDFQRTYQVLTDAETIVEFESPIVEQDSLDPRQYNIVINAISRDLTPITLTMTIIT